MMDVVELVLGRRFVVITLVMDAVTMIVEIGVGTVLLAVIIIVMDAVTMIVEIGVGTVLLAVIQIVVVHTASVLIKLVLMDVVEVAKDSETVPSAPLIAVVHPTYAKIRNQEYALMDVVDGVLERN